MGPPGAPGLEVSSGLGEMGSVALRAVVRKDLQPVAEGQTQRRGAGDCLPLSALCVCAFMPIFLLDFPVRDTTCF